MQPVQRGSLLALTLAGSWRSEPEPFRLSEEELNAGLPPLLKTGCAALAWRRVRDADLAGCQAARKLYEAARAHRLQLAVREQELAAILAVLEANEIRPLLVKGWTLGRYYPERGLRPYGDFDFYVSPDEFELAQSALASISGLPCDVELHREHTFPFDRSVEELYARSERLTLFEQTVAVPCLEDHLRLLCLHLLNHGAWRPLWLCDVAAILETLPASFDWERCLSGHPLYTEWVRSCLALTGELLEAKIDSVNMALPPLPRWFTECVLHQWGLGRGASQHQPLSATLPAALRDPRFLWHEIKAHWRTPIEATLEMRRSFDDKPRFPLQLMATLRRIPRLTGTPHEQD